MVRSLGTPWGRGGGALRLKRRLERGHRQALAGLLSVGGGGDVDVEVVGQEVLEDAARVARLRAQMRAKLFLRQSWVGLVVQKDKECRAKTDANP